MTMDAMDVVDSDDVTDDNVSLKSNQPPFKGIDIESTIDDLIRNLSERGQQLGVPLKQLDDFDQLINSITLLSEECQRLHDDLEIQTIAASKQRYALQVLPPKYKREIEDAVAAARAANEVQMQDLGVKLKDARDSSDHLSNKRETLVRENLRMQPESVRIMRDHDEVIGQLNQKMSDKAKKQIQLNETRDIVRDVRRQTNEIDIGIENLNEDMEQERKVAAQQNRQLDKETEQTEEGIRDTKTSIATQKSTNAGIESQLLEVGVKMADSRKTNRRIENSYTRLKIQVLDLQDKIAREKDSNKEVMQENIKLAANYDKKSKDFLEMVKAYESKIDKIDTQLQVVKEEESVLEKKKYDVQTRAEEREKDKNKVKFTVKEAHATCERLKKIINEKVNQTSDVTQSISRYRDKTEELHENHNATVTTFNQQIQEYSTSLNSEKQDRVKVQHMRDESEKALEEFRMEQAKILNELTKQVSQVQKEHKELTEKSKELKAKNDSNEKKVTELGKSIDLNTKKLSTMESELSMEIERIQTSIELLTSDNARKQDYLKEKRAVIEQLTSDIDSTTAQYKIDKELVVSVRNKEKSVNEQINRSHMKIDRLAKPLLKHKSLLQEKNSLGLSNMEKFSDERKQVEKNVYEVAIKMENIKEENDKLKKVIKKFQVGIGQLQGEFIYHANNQLTLVSEMSQLGVQFKSAWDVCVGMEQLSAQQDQDILAGIAEVQAQSLERAVALEEISVNLKEELDTLSSFVDNVADRRPKDTRQSKRRRASTRGQQLAPKQVTVIGNRRRAQVESTRATVHHPPLLPTITHGGGGHATKMTVVTPTLQVRRSDIISNSTSGSIVIQ